VIVAIAPTGLGVDREAAGQGLEDSHLVDGVDLGVAGHWPGLGEHADRDLLVVDIEPDREQGCLLKSMDLGNATADFQVTRLTGASFIVSTPTRSRDSRGSEGQQARSSGCGCNI
jgi:hypothetical protein